MGKKWLYVLVCLLMAVTVDTVTPFGLTTAKANQVVNVDVTNVVKNITDGPAGMVADYLLDSDIHRPRSTSFSTAVSGMGIKTLRFPYGHLANNYLWTTAPYTNAVNGLTPRVATMSETPGNWSWAVDANGALKNTMDFDEYIQICQTNGIEPVVVVNVMSHKYAGTTVTYSQLKTAAVEWVKYANVTRGYNVKYWQLGNEQDIHLDLLTLSQYESLYKDFAQAMKGIDSNIKTGPGLDWNSSWFSGLLSYAPAQIDFMTAHQYTSNFSWVSSGYQGWKGATDDLIPHMDSLYDAIQQSTEPDTEMLITEISSHGTTWPDGGKNDTYRALAYFEMAANAISIPNTRSIYLWNSHSPWQGENGDPDLPNALDLDNNRKPLGEITRIINANLHGQLVQADRVSGYVRSYASYDSGSGDLTLFLLNKNDASVSVDVHINGYSAGSNYEKWVFKGSGPTDANPTYTQTGTITISGGNVATTSLAPVSLTVVKLHAGTPPITGIKFVDNHGSTDPDHTRLFAKGSTYSWAVSVESTSWTGSWVQWDLIDAGGGNYYIENQGANRRLRGNSDGTVDTAPLTASDNTVKWKLTSAGGGTYYIDRVGASSSKQRLGYNTTSPWYAKLVSSGTTTNAVKWELTSP